VIQQRLPPISAFLDEIRERRLTKCIGHWARKVPPAGLGRSESVDPKYHFGALLSGARLLTID